MPVNDIPGLTAAVWLSVPGKLQVSVRHKLALEYANQLISGLGLHSGDQVPAAIRDKRGISSLTKRAVETILSGGNWRPAAVPLHPGDDVMDGYVVEETAYSRMILAAYDPCADSISAQKDGTATLDTGRQLYFWSPQDFSHPVEYHKHDKCIFELAQGLKHRFSGPRCDREDIQEGSLGKPKFIAKTPAFTVSWAREVAEPLGLSLEDLVGEEVPRGAIPPTELYDAYTAFEWLPRYRHRVLHLVHPDKVYPRIDVLPEHFSEDLQAEHDTFFKCWKRALVNA